MSQEPGKVKYHEIKVFEDNDGSGYNGLVTICPLCGWDFMDITLGKNDIQYCDVCNTQFKIKITLTEME